MDDSGAGTSLDDLPLWLARASLDGSPVDAIMAGFMERLNALGFGVGRAYLGVRLLNPLIRAEGYIYERQAGAVIHERYEHASMPPGYQRSPIHHMLTAGIDQLYRPLQGPEAQLDFDILKDFAARGYSAWAAYLIPFTLLPTAMPDEPLGFIVTLCCDLPEGWSQQHQVAFERLLPHLSAAIQGRVFATLAQDLLATYLGQDAALRVLQGTTTRGDMRSLRAAILYADLRGFTQRGETLDPAALLTSLDRHLELVVTPIETNGGQVLKFMGDGLLAVFPTNPATDAEAARAAYQAAIEALRSNAALAIEHPHAMPVDIALHIGDVLYGNVGGTSRLDFTVIGPAVNAGARMVQKGKELGVPLVMSQEMTRHLDGVGPRSLGSHALRGLTGARELFTSP
ncbi:adenylate/guanylate cyclase domain-containing protein [Dongia sp.]|uniref:adenylate/guanylate cyclase domain-containing protein n=1 Tax=Dongia sp. TaxID=1977262 RepID=UPI0035AF0F36